MPVSRYYSGHGRKVMSSMKKRYGKKKGKAIFYATAANWRKGTAAQRAATPPRGKRRK